MSWASFLTLLTLFEATPTTLASPEEAREESRQHSRYIPELNIEVSLASTYIWRGAPQYSSSTAPSFQPRLWVDFPDLGPGTLTVEVWSAFAMARREYRRSRDVASELDFSLTYDFALIRGWLELGAGFIYYMYPHSEEIDGEKELMLRLGVGNLPVTIAITAWTELHPGLGVYLEPMVGWEEEFGDFAVGVDIALGASIFRGEQATLEHTTLTARMTHTTGRLSLGIYLAYSLRLGPGLGDFIERSMFWGGVEFSIQATGEIGEPEVAEDEEEPIGLK